MPSKFWKRGYWPKKQFSDEDSDANANVEKIINIPEHDAETGLADMDAAADELQQYKYWSFKLDTSEDMSWIFTNRPDHLNSHQHTSQ